MRDLERRAGIDPDHVVGVGLEIMSEGELVYGDIEDWQILASVTPVM